MFCWFERRGAYLRCEVSPVSAGGFELRVLDQHGTERVERFDDSEMLLKRQVAVIDELLEAGWEGPHGWNL